MHHSATPDSAHGALPAHPEKREYLKASAPCDEMYGTCPVDREHAKAVPRAWTRLCEAVVGKISVWHERGNQRVCVMSGQRARLVVEVRALDRTLALHSRRETIELPVGLHAGEDRRSSTHASCQQRVTHLHGLGRASTRPAPHWDK